MKGISIILCCILFAVSSLKVSDFYQGIFTSGQPYGFWEVQAFPKSSNGQINMAYADFNSDKYTDIIVTDNNKQNLFLYIWNPEQSKFINYFIDKIVSSNAIVSVIPNDYNYDGDMDILVTYNKTYNSAIKYDIHIYFGNNCEKECIFTQNSNYVFQQLDPVEPFLIDPQGKGIPSIVFMDKMLRKILVNDDGKYEQQLFADIIRGDNYNFPVLNQHFAAVTDFNGDCFADLILVSQNLDSQYLQFYSLQTNTSKYNLVKNQSFPSIQNIRYADMNNDGSVDIIIIRNISGTLELSLLYNTQSPQEICQLNQTFSFNFTQEQFQTVTLVNKITAQSTLSISDVNMDGYPDILITLNSQTGLLSYLYINTYCSDCTQSTRTFEELTMYRKRSDTFYPVISASFFDLGEDGALDIILNIKDNQSGSVMKPIVNNLKQDSFFVKSLPLSVYSGEDQLINTFGATFQWRITTLEGHSKVSYQNQLSQLSHKSLQLPFISKGLGRTNNYVEDFTVGYSGKQTYTWTPIIPNSRLIITPTGSDWKLGVYVNPNTKIRDVIIITVVILILIGIGIIILLRRQIAQDRNNPSMFFQLIR